MRKQLFLTIALTAIATSAYSAAELLDLPPTEISTGTAEVAEKALGTDPAPPTEVAAPTEKTETPAVVPEPASKIIKPAKRFGLFSKKPKAHDIAALRESAVTSLETGEKAISTMETEITEKNETTVGPLAQLIAIKKKANEEQAKFAKELEEIGTDENRKITKRVFDELYLDGIKTQMQKKKKMAFAFIEEIIKKAKEEGLQIDMEILKIKFKLAVLSKIHYPQVSKLIKEERTAAKSLDAAMKMAHNEDKYLDDVKTELQKIYDAEIKAAEKAGKTAQKEQAKMEKATGPKAVIATLKEEYKIFANKYGQLSAQAITLLTILPAQKTEAMKAYKKAIEPAVPKGMMKSIKKLSEWEKTVKKEKDVAKMRTSFYNMMRTVHDEVYVKAFEAHLIKHLAEDKKKEIVDGLAAIKAEIKTE